MTFLNPLVLLGLAAAAIPLLIHLFNLRRPRRVEFSSLAFLREVQRTTMQRVRIKQWLLLALRTLAIASLVLSFARPSMRSLAPLFGTTGPSAVAIVVDDSPSMTRRDAQGEYFDQARAVAATIARTLDPRDEAFIVTTSGAVDEVPGGAAAAARIAERDVSPVTGTLEGAVARALDALSRSTALDREVYLVSDMQESTVEDTSRAPSEAGEPATLLLVPVGSRTEANVSVEDVRVVSRIVEAGQPVRVEAVVVNHGPAAAAGYTVGVESGGVRLAQTAVDLEPGGRATATLVLSPRERGWLGAAVETEDDAFPPDNVNHFTLRVPERRRILLVAGDGMDPGYVETALSERLTGDRLRFDVTRIPERALPSEALPEFDVVILAGPVDFSSGEVDRLARFVEDGGGVLWFAGRDARLDEYDTLLAAVGAGSVRGWSGSAGAEQGIDLVDRVEVEHPLFEGVFDQVDRTERPVVFLRLDYVPGGPSETTLIASAGGAPFLQEIRFGRGAVLLMTSAPDPAWTDLPTRGLFLPLLYRAIFLLSSSAAVSGDRFLVGQPGELFLAGVSDAQSVEVTGPDGSAVVPPRRPAAGGVLVRLDGLLAGPGTYVVRADAAEVHRFAVNPDPRESDFARMEPEEAARILGRETGIRAVVLDLGAGDPARARAAVVSARRGVELWNVFLLLALLFMVSESAVAALWKPESAA